MKGHEGFQDALIPLCPFVFFVSSWFDWPMSEPTATVLVIEDDRQIRRVVQGYLETSNVNVVQELVSMIQTQRAYEMNSKAVQTSDQMLAKLAQL